jgi:hypothetical protein
MKHACLAEGCGVSRSTSTNPVAFQHAAPNFRPAKRSLGPREQRMYRFAYFMMDRAIVALSATVHIASDARKKARLRANLPGLLQQVSGGFLHRRR